MTELLKDYTDFVCLRQQTFLSKLKKADYVNPVLGESKFTNVQRIFDRLSQFMLRNVLYKGLQSPEEILLRAFVFDQFKTIAFWQYLESVGYEVTAANFSANEFTEIISEYAGKAKLFTTAYIVPGKGGESKAKTIATRAETLIQTVLPQMSMNTEKLFQELKNISGIGDFLASQTLFDCFWHEAFCKSNPLYILGPGAVRGAFKIGLSSKGSGNLLMHEAKYVLHQAMDAIQASEYPFATANGKMIPLNFADVQNTFCETDKWFRLIHPELSAGKNAPTKIKNKYQPGEAIDYAVPGWWIGEDGLVQVDR